MISYIEDTKPPRRRLRIKNKTRFIVCVLVVLSAIVALFIPRQGSGQVSYKPYRVTYGDTYWGIARQLQEQGYRPRADIRDIVHELVQKSGIKAHELKDGDTILIPDIKGD